MAKVGIERKGLYIGAMNFPDRKKPCLVVERGNSCTIIGTFKNEESVEYFGEVLEEFFWVGEQNE